MPTHTCNIYFFEYIIGIQGYNTFEPTKIKTYSNQNYLINLVIWANLKEVYDQMYSFPLNPFMKSTEIVPHTRISILFLPLNKSKMFNVCQSLNFVCKLLILLHERAVGDNYAESTWKWHCKARSRFFDFWWILQETLLLAMNGLSNSKLVLYIRLIINIIFHS